MRIWKHTLPVASNINRAIPRMTSHYGALCNFSSFGKYTIRPLIGLIVLDYSQVDSNRIGLTEQFRSQILHLSQTSFESTCATNDESTGQQHQNVYHNTFVFVFHPLFTRCLCFIAPSSALSANRGTSKHAILSSISRTTNLGSNCIF